LSKGIIIYCKSKGILTLIDLLSFSAVIFRYQNPNQLIENYGSKLSHQWLKIGIRKRFGFHYQ